MPFTEHDVGPAEMGEVIGDTGTDHTAAHHDHLGAMGYDRWDRGGQPVDCDTLVTARTIPS